MSEEVAAMVAIMKEAEGHVDRINAILTDENMNDLTIEQEDLDIVYEILDKLNMLNVGTDICEYLQPVLRRIQGAELMIALRDELETMGVPRAEQTVFMPVG